MKCVEKIIEILISRQQLLDSKKLNSEIKTKNIENLTFDSRQVGENSLFFCKGDNFKLEYLKQAKNNGAIIYISEKAYPIDLPCIIVKSVRTTMPLVADYFYESPYKKLKLIGITGSKGKSSTVYYLKSILDDFLLSQNKKPSGLISGIEVFDGINNTEAKLTTPEALDVYRYLANAVKSGLEYFVIEVSSQALKYERLSGIEFDVVALLNIGHDHIGPLEHPTYEDYIKSKLSIFNYGRFGFYSDDLEFANQIDAYIEKLPIETKIYSTKNHAADYFAEKIKFENNKYSFQVDNQKYYVKGVGIYNVENALCAIAIVNHLKIPTRSIHDGLSQALVPGREQFFMTSDKKIISFISYAHNKISFEKSFQTIKTNFPDYQIIALFGASGNRGLNRIKDLPEVAGAHADFIYLIPDDPANREPQSLSEEMASFLPDNSCSYKIINSREEAITEAFFEAKKSVKNTGKKYFLFIAGKGDEEFQLINGKSIPIRSDIEIAKELINSY
ncbi:MAG: UDP-N-acetylmuramyl-tripeptide synthetase [Clostridiaceae bacterium]|nr:UDP-N-acetylmuramyl-tripeptide synthetase [Clostridiaceae bacterium]